MLALQQVESLKRREVRGGLGKVLILILVLIYALLAILLKSYWKSIVIMSVIPFGFAGAVASHYISYDIQGLLSNSHQLATQKL